MLASGIFDSQPTFNVMARQTAAGYRAAGPLLGGLAGGGAEGIDLPPPARATTGMSWPSGQGIGLAVV